MEQTIPYEIELDEMTSKILQSMQDPNTYINRLLEDNSTHEIRVKELREREHILETELNETRQEREWFETLIEINNRRKQHD